MQAGGHEVSSGASGWGLAGWGVGGREEGDWTGEGHTHHRPYVSCFSLLPRGSWQALCRNRKHRRR